MDPPFLGLELSPNRQALKLELLFCVRLCENRSDYDNNGIMLISQKSHLQVLSSQTNLACASCSEESHARVTTRSCRWG